ncbi:MAG TPA: hypothetical protein ACQGQX_02240, partial [Xylella taiwanensis]
MQDRSTWGGMKLEIACIKRIEDHRREGLEFLDANRLTPEECIAYTLFGLFDQDVAQHGLT